MTPGDRFASLQSNLTEPLLLVSSAASIPAFLAAHCDYGAFRLATFRSGDFPLVYHAGIQGRLKAVPSGINAALLSAETKRLLPKTAACPEAPPPDSLAVFQVAGVFELAGLAAAAATGLLLGEAGVGLVRGWRRDWLL